MAREPFDFPNQNYQLQNALSAYSDEMFTAQRRLSSTGIVGAAGNIDTSTETYIGQMRWFKPTAAVVNTPTTGEMADSADGVKSSFSSSYATYIKRVGTYGHTQINIQQVVSQQDGMAKIARDFGEVRANDEHNAVLGVLKGIAYSEAANAGATTNGTAVATDTPAGGITQFSGEDGGITSSEGNAYVTAGDVGTDTEGVSGSGSIDLLANTKRGFYIDINAAGHFGGAGTDRGLIQDRGENGLEGAVRAGRLFDAVGMGFADYEPDFMYLVTSPEVLSSLRSANLVDQTTVTEGNIEFQTIFGGKFRLIMTRANQGNVTSRHGVTTTAVRSGSTKTSFLVKPGSVAMAALSVPLPVEVDRTAASYGGAGASDIFYRWGYVAHAMGYSWGGSSDGFVEMQGGTNTGTTADDDAERAIAIDGANWERKMDVLNLGVLPLFHS